MRPLVIAWSCIALLASLTGEVGGQTMPFTHYTTEREVNALPSAEVHEVYQDGQGFIWMAIFSSGVVRYDGHRMITYGIEDGLRDASVWDVLQDAQGRLWVASNGGVSVSEKPLAAYGVNERIRFTSTLDGVPLLDVAVNYNRMDVDAQGAVWVGTDAALLVRYHRDADGRVRADTLRTAVGAGDDTPVRALLARRDGSVWVALLGGTLLRYAPGSDVPTPVLPGSGPSTNALYETPDGTLWGGQQSGELWRLREAGGSRRFEFFDPLVAANIASIVQLRRGVLWVASENGGIAEVDPTTGALRRRITRANGLLGDNVFNLLEDREGNVWIAQSGGVSKLRYNYPAFESLTSESRESAPPLLPSPSVNAVRRGTPALDPCDLWVATSDGGLACVTGDASSVIDRTHGLQSNWVNGVAYDAAGRLWIGTSRGLSALVFEGRTPLPGWTARRPVTVLERPAHVYTYPLVSILAVTTGRIAEAAGQRATLPVVLLPAYHVLYLQVGETLVTLGEETGLPQAILHAAVLDDAGHLWVGTRDRGLYRSRQPATRATLMENPASLAFEPVWSVETGAPSNEIQVLVPHRGVLWVGTPQGLVAFDPEQQRPIGHLTMADGLPAANATSLAPSPKSGHLWVGTNGGLAEVDPETMRVVRTVTKQNGLLDNEVWWSGSVAVDATGTVYYGTARGVAIYAPDQDAPNPLPPLLYLTAFEQSEDEGREVAFEYAGLSFANERLVHYRTRLLGYDDDWSEPTADTRLRYTNLSAIFRPKRYTLQVLAANADGVWTEAPLAFPFYVQPPWWLRWWAFALYAVALGVGVFTVDRVQRRRLIYKERLRAHEREQALRIDAAEARATFLNAENERKTEELENARRLQLSLLPEQLPESPTVALAAYMCTATEVGGDYYDAYLDPDGTLTVAIGDATGHGATAGTMVTATKGIFLLLAPSARLDEIVRAGTRAIKQMRFRKLFMAMGLARVKGSDLELVGAGMPPALIYRAATDTVEVVSLKGMPLGGMVDYPYRVTRVSVAPDDVVLLMTDGFTELFNPDREQLGDARAQALFARFAQLDPEEIIHRLMEEALAWMGQDAVEDPLPTRELGNQDDITFVVLKMRAVHAPTNGTHPQSTATVRPRG